MNISKGWNWNMDFAGKESFRTQPALEVCGMLVRWRSLGMKDFLDLGCGLGRHSALFGRHGFSVSAFDISPEAVGSTEKLAKEEGLCFDLRIGDMLSLPYGEDSFDCILGWNVISHTDTVGVKRTLSEIRRVLRPGGECYVTLGSKSAWGWRQDWPSADANTKIRLEEGPENGIPHFYADWNLIGELFGSFEILGVTHVEDRGINNPGVHYHVHVRKPADIK